MSVVKWMAGLAAGLWLAAVAAAADLSRGLAAVERRDWAAALAEFEPLAEQGVPDAQVNLGNLYLKGWGVREDPAAALRWFRKAADQGNAVGQGKLGLMYFFGFGLAVDHAEAARWFRKAAVQGEPGAASILGTLYANGDGVPKNRAEAYFWYTLAADHGHATALQDRDALVDEMSPGEINEALERVAVWRQRTDPAGPTPKQSAQEPEKPRATKEPRPKKRKAE